VAFILISNKKSILTITYNRHRKRERERIVPLFQSKVSEKMGLDNVDFALFSELLDCTKCAA